MSRAGPLTIDHFVKVVRIRNVGGFHHFLVHAALVVREFPGGSRDATLVGTIPRQLAVPYPPIPVWSFNRQKHQIPLLL
jgi:hypothetical protein